MKGKWGRREQGEERDKGEKEREMENKVKELERWKEREEREKNRRYVMVKGIEVKEGGIKKAVGELWKMMGMQAEVEDVWEINQRKAGDTKMALVKMKNREGKRKVMQKKGTLRGKDKRIEDE